MSGFDMVAYTNTILRQQARALAVLHDLPACCANCQHFDQDAHCALVGKKLITGHIPEPELVVCAKHEVRER